MGLNAIAQWGDRLMSGRYRARVRDEPMMKAFVLSQYGAANNLELKAIAKPVPRAGEVLVKVYATAINDWDWCLLRGSPAVIRLFYGLWRPRITILGAEIAGRVEAVGENAAQFQPGDAVYGDISDGGGGFAEYVCVPETALTRKPEPMSFAQAAALPHAAALALQGLRDQGQLRPQQKVLINGAGGGVGTLAVQIARAAGVTEITGVDDGSKAELMRSLGFTHTIDYTQTDFTAGPQRYDLILDTKTNHFPLRYLRVLNPGGTYVTVGGATPNLLQTLLLGPFVRRLTQKDLRLVVLKPNQDMAAVNRLFEAHQLTPQIDGPYSFSQIPALIQYFGAGEHQGKIVVKWAGDSNP
ncbi:NAD(P)-dependent alcohol dehydrogenase [Nodosilinea sp. AN01ver1]|uniref:NAD(P)-dependent alcohol dehydrogenase n=1 Tax=Nodosilinea sp. AN01ver1 TaxID=3423362 RepID=UPI003D31E7C0